MARTHRIVAWSEGWRPISDAAPAALPVGGALPAAQAPVEHGACGGERLDGSAGLSLAARQAGREARQGELQSTR